MEKTKLPNHIAIIPDGNRRWARAHKLAAVWEGHREGAKRFEELVESAFSRGISYFTFWASSEDNFTKRNPAEVDFFLSLFEEGLKRILSSDFLEKQIKVRVIGKGREINKNRARLCALIDELEEKTKAFNKHHLIVLFGYDGKSEMAEAIEILRNSKGAIDQQKIKGALWTSDLPPVDLVIRTGGEPHWSAGFMMWHTADAQLYFTETLWPDFGVPEFEQALQDYASRERRFGK